MSLSWLRKIMKFLQNKVIAQISKVIADAKDEAKWDDSFARTHDSLVAAAQKAKQERAEGKASPMDYDRL